MRPVVPAGDNLPENVQRVKFDPPPGQEDEVNPIVGIVHHDPEGNKLASEFMFELTEDEIAVLNHEPFVTIVVYADHLHPFAIQTSYPAEEKYHTLNEHTHFCVSNLTHDEKKPWLCENPRHEMPEMRERECPVCWNERQIQVVKEAESGQENKELPSMGSVSKLRGEDS